VIHYQSPGSPIAYYQQVGRAGRALEHAPAVLMRGREDRDIQDFFIGTAFPPREQAEAVVGFLAEQHGPVSLPAIEAVVNVRRSRLTTMLKVLEVEGAIGRDGNRWIRTPEPWRYDEERVRRVTDQRRIEQQAMVDYATTTKCLMEFLRLQLDDPDAAPCGRCANCTGERWDVSPGAALVDEAKQHLRGQILAIEPRRQWPAGLDEPKGRIAPELQAEEGRALSGYGDGELGSLVAAEAGQEDPWFSDELVEASATMIRGTWRPEVAWVTCVPSHRHVDLVPSFARRLADALDLPFVEAVRKTGENRPQRESLNSAQQLRNVWKVFEASGDLLQGPALLVDDTVDSRWTLTVIAAALRAAGSGPVVPFALADARGA
jgi:ATP-dependent DNA helicase RecQ